MPQSLLEHITAMPGRLQSVVHFKNFMLLWFFFSGKKTLIGLPYCGGCQGLHFYQFHVLSFCVSMETGAQAPARETEWDQCSANHGSLPLCKLCAHQRPTLWAWWTQGVPHWSRWERVKNTVTVILKLRNRENVLYGWKIPKNPK